MYNPISYKWFYEWHYYLEKPSAVLDTAKNWYRNTRSLLLWVKFSRQRAFRGWADCDIWNMDHYLVEITLPMLRAFKEDSISYPGRGNADTPEKWNAILAEMIEGFEAAHRVCEDDYYKEVSGDSIEALFNATSGEVKEWGRLKVEDQKLFKAKMKVFTAWFFDLWD